MKKITRLIALLTATTALSGNIGMGTAASEAPSESIGEGMLISVLSTGFALEQDSFIITNDRPKLSREESDALLSSSNVPLDGENAPDSVYVSEKVPFAYDYGDMDTDVYSATNSDIGTAVISVCAGNDSYEGSVLASRGEAPEAQVLAMKIYSDKKASVSTDAVIMAIEDSVILGADVILMTENFSIGTLEKGVTDRIDAALMTAKEAGIAVICPAGDCMSVSDVGLYAEYTFSMPTDRPDVGSIGYPASSELVFSVGNAVSNKLDAPAFLLGGLNVIPFSDTNGLYENLTEGKSFSSFFDSKTFDYIVIDGIGTPEQLNGVKLEGKFAVVKRGELSFTQKAINAAAKGAVGVIVIDNQEDETESMKTALNLEGAPIPVILISAEGGRELKSSEVRSFTVKYGLFKTLTVRETPSMSKYSAVGTSPTLELKPDITAVGTNVECLTANGSYAYLDSTIASAAKAAGMYAVLLDELQSEHPELSRAQLMTTVYAMLASSAELLAANSGTLYSPRSQGSGNASLEAARAASVLLYSENSHKIDLGDGNGRLIQFKVTAENISERALECTLDASVGSDSFVTYSVAELDKEAKEHEMKISDVFGFDKNGEVSFIESYTEFPDTSIRVGTTLYQLNKGRADYEAPTVTLAPGARTTFDITVYIDDPTYRNYLKHFPNGFFVEGFIKLSASDGSTASIPFCGFCGDFSASPALDAQYLDSAPKIYGGTYLYRFISSDFDEAQSGTTVLGEYSANAKMAFSPYADSANAQIFMNFSLFKTVYDVFVEVRDSNGTQVSLKEYDTVFRTAPYKGTGNAVSATVPVWDGRAEDYFEYVYPEGYYTVTVSFRKPMSSVTESFTYTLFSDQTAPEYVSYSYEMKNNVPILTVEAKDNHSIQSITVTDSRSKQAWAGVDGTVDLTGLIGEYLYIDIRDSAFNSTVVRILNPVLPAKNTASVGENRNGN